jgi:amidase
MSEQLKACSRSAFVPHDLKAPIVGQGDGPLAGLQAAVKDMYDIAGSRTGGGNPDWLRAQAPATATAVAVQRLLDAGASIIGKAVCDEFFFSLTGANAHYGTPINPRVPHRLPGGSSSGSASATAAGACDFALGSDTGGSVRVPAAFCGIFGIRPTHGRVDLAGAMAMAPSFDVPGWFASGPGVFQRVGNVLLQGPGAAAPIRDVIILDDAFAEADAEVASFLRAALDTMADNLPNPVRARIAPGGFDGWREIFRIIQASEVWQTFGSFVEKHQPRMGPGIRERMQFAASVQPADVAKARQDHARVRAHIHAVARPGTVLALPTAPCIPPLLATSAEGLESFRVRAMRLTCIAGLGGLPQVSLPIGTADGAPVGLSFIAWSGGDEELLSLAVRLARYCGYVQPG